MDRKRIEFTMILLIKYGIILKKEGIMKKLFLGLIMTLLILPIMVSAKELVKVYIFVNEIWNKNLRENNNVNIIRI